jgi:hypothetical protein
MSIRDLRRLLGDIEDTHELVLGGPGCAVPPGGTGELRAAWAAARAEANRAYEAWRACRGVAAYSIYRAAQDRVDAAQDALAMAGEVAAGARTNVTKTTPGLNRRPGEAE